MFKSISVKVFLTLMFSLALSACATFSGGPSASQHSDTRLAQSFKPVVQRVPIAYKPLAIEIPSLIEVSSPTTLTLNIPAPNVSLSDRAQIELSDKEIQCMAYAIYFEARGEGTLGQVGVGYVILNRMGHHKFPNTACGVVYDRNRRGCQFHWVCDGKPDAIRSPQSYEQARATAISVLTRSVKNPVGDSLFFRHRNAVSPYAGSQRLYASIGQHNFFAVRR